MKYGILIFIGWLGCCSVSYGFGDKSTVGNRSPDTFEESRMRVVTDNELYQQALAALQARDLDKAGELLDKLIARREQTVDKLANDHSRRAKVFELQFKPVEALQHAEQAYRYRPENTEYAHAYATLLAKQNQQAQAISIYEQSLQRQREKGDKADAALTTNNMSDLYRDTQQKKDEASYQAELSIYSDLIKTIPQAYLPNVAGTPNNLYYKTQRLKANTLNDLGNLYYKTQRFKEGEASYQEALTIYRDLAKADPQVYRKDLADTLSNLGLLYRDTQRFKEEKASYQEALTIYQDLAKANPQVYRKDLADALRKIMLLCYTQGKTTEAHHYSEEAISLFRELWQADPKLYADKFYITLITNVLTLSYSENTETHCALLKEAWQVAPSEKYKMAVLNEDKERGGHCKLQDLSKPAQ